MSSCFSRCLRVPIAIRAFYESYLWILQTLLLTHPDLHPALLAAALRHASTRRGELPDQPARVRFHAAERGVSCIASSPARYDPAICIVRGNSIVLLLRVPADLLEPSIGRDRVATTGAFPLRRPYVSSFFVLRTVAASAVQTVPPPRIVAMSPAVPQSLYLNPA